MSNLKIGRELDALVAEKVMNIHVRKFKDDYVYWRKEWPEELGGDLNPIKNYSTSIAAAWEVVEKLLPLYAIRLDLTFRGWECYFDDRLNIINLYLTAHAISSTPPHAICLAALKAVGHLYESDTHRQTPDDK